MKDLNVRPETIKFPEENRENIGNMVSDTDLSDIFLALSPQTRETKAQINKCKTTSNQKAFAQQRKLSTKQKDNLLNRRRYL